MDPKRKVVLLEDGEEVPYDIVVIATGSSVPFPGKVGLNIITSAEAEELFREFQEKVRIRPKYDFISFHLLFLHYKTNTQIT